MHVIEVDNVNQALVKGMHMLTYNGQKRESRNGPVTVMDGPVTTVYKNPKDRVIFWPIRDANPFFHFMEGLWMLAGRNDVNWISTYNSTIANYSDDGISFHGAYGWRWRNFYDMLDREPDQLKVIAEILKKDPTDRRCVLQMWSTEEDLGRDGKDFPCNTQIYFVISPYGNLDMTVCCRSNDMIWGAYGANAVHMSMLQEVMAAWIGVPVGRYWQLSNNFHGYDETMEKNKGLLDPSYSLPGADLYSDGVVTSYPMVSKPIDIWMQDLMMFMDEGPIIGFREPFFRKVVIPLHVAWLNWKDNDIDGGLQALKNCAATDWRLACEEWLERRR